MSAKLSFVRKPRAIRQYELSPHVHVAPIQRRETHHDVQKTAESNITSISTCLSEGHAEQKSRIDSKSSSIRFLTSPIEESWSTNKHGLWLGIILFITGCIIIGLIFIVAFLTVPSTSTTTRPSTTTITTTTATTASTTTTTTSPTPPCTPTSIGSASNIYTTTSGSVGSYSCMTYEWTSPTTGLVTLAFQLRQDPDYWYLDDVSVYAGATQMIINGGFETGSLPPWVRTTPNGPCSGIAGTVSNAAPHSGIYGFVDGSYQCADEVSQQFMATAGQNYIISFWLLSGQAGAGVLANVTLM